MAEFSAGFQTRQEERYVFWLLLGGDLTYGDDLWRLLVPKFPRKIGGDALIRDCGLNQANTVLQYRMAPLVCILGRSDYIL